MRPTSYDELWHTAWGDMQRFGPVHRHIQQDLVRTVGKLSRVESILEVGCGSGENLAALAAAGHETLVGVDISSAAIELAKRNVPRARISLLDAQRERLEERFDLVISIQVIEHLVDDVAALKNMAEMTRRHVFISTMSGRMRSSERKIGHVRNYSEDELAEKIEGAGLRIKSVRGWGFPFYSPLYRSLIELLPGGPPSGPTGGAALLAARALYQLYRLNVPGRGDVISVLAERNGA